MAAPRWKTLPPGSDPEPHVQGTRTLLCEKTYWTQKQKKDLVRGACVLCSGKGNILMGGGVTRLGPRDLPLNAASVQGTKTLLLCGQLLNSGAEQGCGLGAWTSHIGGGG